MELALEISEEKIKVRFLLQINENNLRKSFIVNFIFLDSFDYFKIRNFRGS